jgi:ABC-2 type transport system ATP-binding protein
VYRRATLAGRQARPADSRVGTGSSGVSWTSMLTLSGITKRYGDRTAVDGLSLDVARGEILGLLGPNGAGKTTTMHIAVGLLRPDAGEVTVAGLGSPLRRDVRRAIGIAPQSLALYDLLTAEENLRFFAEIYGLPRDRVADRVDWALGLVGLQDRRRDRVDTFSGGMKRRINIAAALLHEPDIVLLDEPTVGVDPQSRNAIFESIEHLKAAGTTIVYSTHYMEEAVRLCDRVAIVDHGRLLALDSVEGLIARYGGDRVLVTRSDGDEVRTPTRDPLAALQALASRRPIDYFRVDDPTLEQVFLSLTGRELRD